MSHEPILTIAIPTYDRNAILRDNLRLLLEQLNAPEMRERCRLLVLDNSSPHPVEDSLRALQHEFAGVDFQIQRNVANIGANANILRCFELCETPWLWVLGDDDRVLKGAIQTALRNIEANPDCVFVNFSSNMWERPAALRTRGLEQFVDAIDSLWAVLFISSSLYRMSELKGALRVAYRYEYSHASQLVILLSSLGSDGECLLSTDQIVHWNQPDDEQQWPVLNFALAIPTILELPMPMPQRKRLAGKIVESVYLELLVMQLLLQAVSSGDKATSLYLYDQLCARLYHFDRNPRRLLKTTAYRAMLQTPRSSLRALDVIKGRRKSALPAAPQNRFERI